MGTSRSESIVREAPEIEAYKLGLLKSGKTLADKALKLPTQKVAGLSDLEKKAIGQTGQVGGIGGYRGLAQSGRDTLGTGLGTMGQALGALSYAPGYMDASASALGRSEQSLGQSTGLYGGGPGYESQGFNAQQGPAAVNYTADQYQAGPGYTAASFDPNSASQYFNPYENPQAGRHYRQPAKCRRRTGGRFRRQPTMVAVRGTGPKCFRTTGPDGG
jgi:hypothetical protein